jgi:hypothetical protein
MQMKFIANYKLILISPAILLVLCLQTISCYQQSDKLIEMGGPSKNTNLVVFFNKGVSHEQIKTFYDDILSKPSPYGKNTGYDLQDGMASRFRLLNGNYEGVGINFSTDVTPEQRERLKKNIRESPIVYKVYENVVPSEIKDL